MIATRWAVFVHAGAAVRAERAGGPAGAVRAALPRRRHLRRRAVRTRRGRRRLLVRHAGRQAPPLHCGSERETGLHEDWSVIYPIHLFKCFNNFRTRYACRIDNNKL